MKYSSLNQLIYLSLIVFSGLEVSARCRELPDSINGKFTIESNESVTVPCRGAPGKLNSPGCLLSVKNTATAKSFTTYSKQKEVCELKVNTVIEMNIETECCDTGGEFECVDFPDGKLGSWNDPINSCYVSEGRYVDRYRREAKGKSIIRILKSNEEFVDSTLKNISDGLSPRVKKK